jgi:hypothetical protein
MDRKTPARNLEFTNGSGSIGTRHPPHLPSPRPSPESTPSNEVDPPQIFPGAEGCGW